MARCTTPTASCWEIHHSFGFDTHIALLVIKGLTWSERARCPVSCSDSDPCCRSILHICHTPKWLRSGRRLCARAVLSPGRHEVQAIGVSTAISLLALIAIVSTVEGKGPFIATYSQHVVLSMQLFLAVLSVPMLFVAILIEERREHAGTLAVPGWKSVSELATRWWDGSECRIAATRIRKNW